MKRTLLILLCILLFTSSVLLASCGVDYTEDELKTAAAELIEKSYEVNEIYFGKGLPAVEQDSEEAKKFADGLDVDITAVSYLPVSEDCPYTSIDQLKQLASDVYTADYCEFLWKRAFEGMSSDDGAAVYARYMTDFMGVLTVRSDVADTGAELNRTYDTENITVDKMKKDTATVTLTSYVDGEKDQDVSFVLKLEANGWRLDQPTY